MLFTISLDIAISQAIRESQSILFDESRALASPMPRSPFDMGSGAAWVGQQQEQQHEQEERDRERERDREARETVITAEIYYDIICPFSYTIKHTLETAVERYERAHRGVRVDMLWRPHCIIPPLERRVDKSQLYKHFERLNPGTLAILNDVGPRHGIHFHITGSTGSSRAAHRLVQLALRRLGPRRQADVLEALYRGHFVEGRDISDPRWLLAVGTAAGLRRGLVRGMLREMGVLEPNGGRGGAVSPPSSSSSDLEEEDDEDEDDGLEEDEDDDEDEDEDEDAYSVEVPAGVEIEAVPCVIIQGRYKVGGLQEAELFEGVFDKVRAASKS